MSQPAKRLRWTRRPPSGPGRYWVRGDGKGEKGIVPVFMVRVHSRLRAACRGPNGQATLVADLPYEWAGPIPEPEEAPP